MLRQTIRLVDYLPTWHPIHLRLVRLIRNTQKTGLPVVRTDGRSVPVSERNRIAKRSVHSGKDVTNMSKPWSLVPNCSMLLLHLPTKPIVAGKNVVPLSTNFGSRTLLSVRPSDRHRCYPKSRLPNSLNLKPRELLPAKRVELRLREIWSK
jgi:hypothetical protein